MAKYLQVFKISLEEELAYRLNFILWRVRNVFQILLTYFLWSTVFVSSQTHIFGYDRAKILTYIFGIIIVRAMVLPTRAMDIASDIAEGDLSNYLVRPISYFKYWFTRDLSSKILNLGFAAVEFVVLFLLLKPPFLFQTNLVSISGFLAATCLAVLIYFFLTFLVSSIPFWVPELAWGSHFLVTVVIVEALSGSLFPINILPDVLQSVVLATPFPYLIYFPVEVYLGNITGSALAGGLMMAAAWAGILGVVMNFVWQKGLKVYQAFGR
jgi:ABC-2 type transport system permease protein